MNQFDLPLPTEEFYGTLKKDIFLVQIRHI